MTTGSSVGLKIDADAVALVASTLKAQSPALRKAMAKAITGAALPLRDDLRATVRGLNTSGAKGSGRAQRGVHALTANKRFAGMTAEQRAKAVGRAAKRAGLRDTIARGIRVEYRDNPRSAFIGVKVRTSVSALPGDQRGLPRAMNKGHWRHPVFAKGPNPADWTWVEQSVTPADWWKSTADRHYGDVKRAVEAAVTTWAATAGVDLTHKT